jgi:hypothetical protein
MRFQCGGWHHNLTAGGGSGALSPDQNATLYRMQQAFLLHLHQPHTLDLSIRYARLQAAWLHRLCERQPPSAALAALELVPSFVVGDMCTLLIEAIQGAPDAMALHDLQPLTLAIAALLRAGSPALNQGMRLVRSPVVLAQLLEVCYYLVVPSRSRRRSSSALLGASGWGGDVGGRLSEAVLGDARVRVSLVVPLAAAYAALDAVEGLDVDAVENELPDGGQFEKFGLRQKINTLLLQLWRLPDARDTLCAAATGQPTSGAAGGDGGAAAAEAAAAGAKVVAGLANGMLDTLLYQLEEALKRIRECNLAAWDESATELLHSQGYCKALLEGSSSTLELMGALTTAPELAAVFASPPVVARTAAASLQFLTKLCAKPRALAVKSRWPSL